MDFVATLLVSALTSLGTLVTAALAFGKKIADHALARNLQSNKADLDSQLQTSKAALDQQLATSKAQLENSLRQASEIYLGDHAADRQYRLEARKRLYLGVGPLRFQLLLASANYVDRIHGFGGRKFGDKGRFHTTSLAGYFGKSTFYRLGRLLALAELIERQIAYADFSVDPSTVRLLRFKRGLSDSLSSSSVILDHPKADWTRQSQHVFGDMIPIIAAAMIIVEAGDPPTRAMRFDELDHFLAEDAWRARIHPLPRLFESFSPKKTPILWLRLIAIAHLCTRLINIEGEPIGLPVPRLDLPNLLTMTGDAHILGHLADYETSICAPGATLPDASAGPAKPTGAAGET